MYIYYFFLNLNLDNFWFIFFNCFIKIILILFIVYYICNFIIKEIFKKKEI